MFKRVILLTCTVFVCALVLTGVTKAEDPSLVGWWKLDETSGTIAYDSAGDNNGVLYGGPAWEPIAGKRGGALRFDGIDDLVDCGNRPALTIQDQITMACWIKVAAFTREWETILAKGDDSYRLSRSNTWGNAAHMGISGTSVNWFDGVKIVTGDEWHHIAGVYDGSAATIYVDGTADTVVYATGRINASYYNLFIGENPQMRARYLTGRVDDVRIYSRALTREEIVGIMAGGEDVSLASNPDPADGSVLDVDAVAVLSWSPGGGATQHDVYFGPDKGAVEQASTRVPGVYRGRQTGATYYVSDALVMGQTYYWRIDEVDKSRVVYKGAVWSFTVADYLIVDSFELYDDLCSQIFFIWLDGAGHLGSGVCGKAPYGGNGTGSMVETAIASDATRTVVHSGEQSMQLTYDNSTGPYYSQTERTFSPAQDWTRFDVNMVTLYVRGDPGNGLGVLYAGVEDSAQHSKRISHVDPEAVAKGYWKRWDIPLSEFAAGSVNLKSIKKLVIGIGDRTSAKADGQGKVYIDDIRLTKGGGSLRPVAYWEFEEGSGNTASDSAGLNDGTVVGATWVPGKIGKALSFDGFDDYVDCGSDGALNPAELTVTLWVCPENVYVMAQSLVAKVGSESSDVDYSLQIGIMGAVKGLFRAGDSNVVVSGARNLVAGEWTHLALTRDGSEMALYMDGGNRTSVGYSVQPGNGGYPLRIGGPRAYQGKIDDVRIYDQALPPEQIEQIAGGQM